MHAGDVDGDGDIDLVVASGTDSRVYWAENNGSQGFILHTLINNGAGGMRSVFMIDIDSDGDMDIVAASSPNDYVYWFESDGAADPSFTARMVSSQVDGAMSVYAADMDNDGDIDILAAAQEEDKIYWFESNGAFSGKFGFSVTTITSSADGIYSVYAKDLDNDGDMDVLSAASVDDKIAWYKACLLYTSPRPPDRTRSRRPASA